MSWSKIKKAINSTLGTDDFKPIDVMLKEAFADIKTRFSNLTTSLTIGENQFIVEKSRNCELAQKAAQTAIPVTSINVNNSTLIVNNVKVGIYIFNKYTSYYPSPDAEARLTGYVSDMVYISDAVLNRKKPDNVTDTSNRNLTIMSSSGNAFTLDYINKTLTSLDSSYTDYAYISTDETKT